MCPTCSRRGYSSCTAQLPVARTCCERCHRPTPLTSQLPTMPLSTLPGADAGGWRWRHAAPGAQLPTGAPGRTPPERCGNSNRAFWPPFSARCWTRRSVEPPPSTRAAEQAAPEGFPAPNWAKLLEEDAAAPADLTTRPAPGERPGGQRTASKALHKRALETLFTELDPTSRALLLSQGGDAASCAPTAFPTSADTRVPDDEFRVMLLRRLRPLLPLAAKRCACGGLLDVYGDHRSALRAPACSLLELPIEGPGDPTDGLEVALGELLAGHQPPVPSRL